MRSLQKVGRILGNCVAKKKYARSYLNNSDMETWALLEERQPMSLLTVDKDTRLVGEFEAAGGSVPKLKRSLAFKILNGLDINGDDDYAFAKVGAFYVFRHGTPAVSPIEIGDCQHNVWVVRDGAEIIIASKRSGERKKRWSRFSRHQSFVEAAWPSHLKEADLLGLLLDHPSFAERLSNRTANDEPATAPLEKNHV